MFNKRRLIQAISFELGALVLFVLIFAPLLDHSTTELGALGLAFSLLTVILLYFYNQLFDRALRNLTGSAKKSGVIRILHAFLFEVSLVIFSLPAIAWWLEISLLNALILEVAAVTFMVIYTYVFHWVVENYLYKAAQ